MVTLPLTLPSATYWCSWRVWCAAKKNELICLLVKRAKTNLRTCIAQNEKRLTFPELFTPLSPPTRSPYRWNDKFTKRDLIELATALEATQAILADNGKPISFAELISNLEQLFNITLSNPYKERDLILQRKKCITDFTARMVRAIDEKSATK